MQIVDFDGMDSVYESVQSALEAHQRLAPDFIAMLDAAPKDPEGRIIGRWRCPCGRMADGGPEPAGECLVMQLNGPMLGRCSRCWAKFNAQWDEALERYRDIWTGRFVRDPWEDEANA